MRKERRDNICFTVKVQRKGLQAIEVTFPASRWAASVDRTRKEEWWALTVVIVLGLVLTEN